VFRSPTLAVGSLALALLAAACSGTASEPSTTKPPATSVTSVSPDEPEVEESDDDESVPAEIDIDALLAKDPLVIFNAYPPKPAHISYPLPPGQRDFDELWEPGAPWSTALGHVDIYRLHAFQLRHFMDDEQVVALVEFLDEHQIPLMFETEPLIPPDPEECAHTESYEAPYDLEMAARLKGLGGRVDIIAIEEPYHFGHLLDSADACQYSVERVVEEVLQHVRNLRGLFGDVPVGTIEPIWISPSTEPGDMEVWLDTFEEIAGEPFAFLHVDPNWYREDWAEVAVGIEAVADARSIPFGVLYNGGVEPDGLSWMNFMMANVAELEIEHGATPQHLSFQSWVDWPDHALPETDLTALTSSIVRYFGQRIQLSADRTDAGLEARVTAFDGEPLQGVRLEVGRVAAERSVATQTVNGVVPDDIIEALVLVRANAENATVGEVAATLLEVSFSDGAGGPNLVPNGQFADGADHWGVYGSHPEGVRPVATDSGRGLALSATTTQDIFIDGTRFPVTSGDDFEFSVTYELDGGTPGSVVVSVAFVGLSRTDIFLHHVPEDLGAVVTDADGSAIVPGEWLIDGPATLIVTTSGTLDHWPATVTFEVE